MAKKLILEILIFSMVVLYLYAGVSKLLDVQFFELQLIRSPWIGQFNTAIAWTVPFFEIGVSVLLIAGGKARKIGLYLFAFSLSVFSIYISAVLVSGQKAPCSCGGLIQHLSWPQHIILNLSFVAISIIAIRLNKPTKNQTELIEHQFT